MAKSSGWSVRAARVGGLPAQPTALIGRERELAQLAQQLARDDVRLLTLTGPAGTGKTRLAVQLAGQLAGAFEDGSVFVDLAPVSNPALVVSTIATAVGLPDVGSQPLLDTLKRFLADRHLLLLVDNFEHLVSAASLLSTLLAATTRLKVVVTSRAALRLWHWEHEFPLAPLSLPDARLADSPAALERVPSVALFLERARARRPDFVLSQLNARPVTGICVRLDGLPLALELAAAGVKLLSPHDILARLESRVDLPGAFSGDVPTRHQTLREAIAWSHDLLDREQQVLFRRLGVFAGGFSLAAAETICSDPQVPEARVLPLLGQLVDQSLVMVEERGTEMRYRLLETIREFATAELESSGEEDQLRRRHAEWCTQLGRSAEAELRGARQSIWLDRLELEHDNLRAALAWFCGHPETDRALGLSLGAALWQFWWLRGYLSEGRQQLDLVLSQAGAPGSTPEWTRALLAAGVLAFRQGDYSAAQAHLDESLERARSRGDHAATAVALRSLGRMAIDRGEFAAARTQLADALAIDRALDNASGTAWSLNYLGLLAYFEADHGAARTLLEQSLPLMRTLRDQWGTAVALAYLGCVVRAQGDIAAAQAVWTESLETCRSQGYLWCVPYLLEFFAGLAIARGEAVRGMRLAGAAQALHDSIGAPLPRVWQPVVEQDLTLARRTLGEAAAAAALAAGRALALDDAVREVHQQPRSRSGSPELETRYARSGEVNIAYQVLGQGPLDLIFVMGWIGHLDYYWAEPHFARFLRGLASRARVILFDKRGTGLSDRGVGSPTLEERADDVRAVMDAVGSERAVVLGVSEAGALCALFAATHPERTEALVLIGCCARRVWAPDYPWGASRDEREVRISSIEREWGSVAWAARDLAVRAPSVVDNDDFVRWWATYLRMSASPGAAIAVSRMNTEIDVRPVLPAISVPTLIVHRAEDRVIKVEAGRHLAAHIRGARYVELPGSDHLPFTGDQDAILDAIRTFLATLQPPGALDRVLATVVAIEVADAPGALARVGAARWHELEAEVASLMRERVTHFRGVAAGAAGNAFLATFDGPARAVRCAQSLTALAAGLGVSLRAAVHTGECDLVDGRLTGRAFRIATWALTQAEADQVLVTSAVRDLVVGAGMAFSERGERQAPDGMGTWRLFAADPNSRALAEPAPAAPTAAQRSPSLTPREREVAILLAQGFTNRQIGERLVISPATAERHVVNILNKLNFHSRSQVAAWVVAHGLLANAG